MGERKARAGRPDPGEPLDLSPDADEDLPFDRFDEPARRAGTTGKPAPTTVAAPPIHGHDNKTLKYVRSLQRRHTRRQERAFVVEGVRAVADALAAGVVPTLLLVRDDESGEEDFAAMPPLDPALAVRTVVPALFDGLTDTVSPQGVLAVFPFPDLPLPETRSPLYLIVDRLRDPGNLGTLLRTAAGAGVSAVFVSRDAVDPFNPKTVRGAMGAHFRVPLRALGEDESAAIVAACPLRVLADAAGVVPYDAVDWTQPAALIVGSEATGASTETRDLATISAAVPLAGGVESLNAAVAASVLLFEANRQRRRGPRRSAPPEPGAGAGTPG